MMRLFAFVLLALLTAQTAMAAPLTRAQIEPYIVPPYALGEQTNANGVWSLRNSGDAEAGYVFETEPMAPIPGFSGAPINILVILDLEGRFIDVRLISHNEPIFVSGLGEAPFHKFFEQYRGHSISESLVVGTPYGSQSAGGQLVYLDGVTKATASVRIAHESLLAATLQVAREKMQGISTSPPPYPDPDYTEPLTWDDLVSQGIATRFSMSNAEIDARFAGTLWESDDPEAAADPEGTFLDLWIIDVGPPSIAKAVLSADAQADLAQFQSISTSDEPLLIIETGRHGLVSEEFVRNTSPDWISATQDGFPVALRDADLFVELASDLPDQLHDGVAMILRTDRRLGFDPTRDWELQVQAVRSHGMFQPEIGSVTMAVPHKTDDRFYLRPVKVTPVPPWLEAIRGRQTDLAILAVGLVGLFALLTKGMNRLAGHPLFTPIRLTVLAMVTVFIGWWGQGQLSIVTVLGVIRAAFDGGSFAFLLYDPFGLLVWAAALIGFVIWGRALFCGWLCPFGALQEFTHHLGRLLRLPRIEPSVKWDTRLKALKYIALVGLIAAVIFAPDRVDKAAEIEPFKTAITTFFLREWYYVAYAAFWLLLGMVVFKGFCRYVCPLGAFMAIGGLIRGRDWIERRAECGSPCQLCKVKCSYGAIKKTGEIVYSECFGCLDCVTIHDDPAQCVPKVLAARQHGRKQRIAAQ